MTRPPSASGVVTDLRPIPVAGGDAVPAMSFVVDEGVGVFVPATLSVPVLLVNESMMSAEGAAQARAMLAGDRYLHMGNLRPVPSGRGYAVPDENEGFALFATTGGTVCADTANASTGRPQTLWCTRPVFDATVPTPAPPDPQAPSGCPGARPVADESHHEIVHVDAVAFTPNELTFHVGETYSVTLVSDEEKVAHSWALEGALNDNGTRICVAYTPSSETDSVTFIVSTPGTYTFRDLLHPNISGALS